MKWALVAVWLATGDAFEIDNGLTASDCAEEWRKAEASPEIALTDSIVVQRGGVELYCTQEQ